MIKYTKGKIKTYDTLSEEYKVVIFQIVCNELDKLLNGTALSKKEIIFFRWLKRNNYKNLEKILIGKPDVLHDLNLLIKKKITQGKLDNVHTTVSYKTSTTFGNNIKKVFNYKGLRKYFIDFLYEELDIPVCPYCNRIYTTVVKTKKRMGNNKINTLFTLDHFYSQLYYPYLSISFYNLIPSCSGCNSILKNSNSFSVETHLHPYVDSFNDYLKFSYIFKDADYLEKKENMIVLTLIPNERALFHGKSNFERALRSSEDFFIKEIYDTNKDYVFEILQKAKIYTPQYLNSLYSQFLIKLKITKTEFHRLVLSNYITDDELHKRPLAKLTKDIGDKSGIL